MAQGNFNKTALETFMGAFVLLIAVFFLVFTYSRSSVGSVDGYLIKARFDRVDGISPGADVRLSGIKIGSVKKIELDEQTYQAVVHMSVQDDVELPVDTAAEITSNGLLGDSYLAVVPGGEEEMLQADDVIAYTQPPVNLVQMLSKFIFSAAEQNAQ